MNLTKCHKENGILEVSMKKVKIEFSRVMDADEFGDEAEFIPIVADEDEQNVSDFEMPDIFPIMP